jgi:hypothetical protein
MGLRRNVICSEKSRAILTLFSLYSVFSDNGVLFENMSKLEYTRALNTFTFLKLCFKMNIFPQCPSEPNKDVSIHTGFNFIKKICVLMQRHWRDILNCESTYWKYYYYY